MAQALKIVPLGGLGEIGKNMTVFEYGRNIMIVDAGVMFPEHDMLGIDLVIPDWGYLKGKESLVRGIVVTHGHEDHIGALPFLLKHVSAPIYATPLAMGLVENKLKRYKLHKSVARNVVNAGEKISVGPFQVEFVAVSHSIPDGVGLSIETPVGRIFHSGDFKFDYTPVQGTGPNLSRIGQLGAEGVRLLMSDSTGAERSGFTPSEQIVEETFDRIIRKAKGRVIVTTFASLLSRIQQITNVAHRHGRKVALVGYSMLESVKVARRLGYLEIPKGVLVRANTIGKYPPEKVVIIATGAQGQPEAALARIARGEHREIEIQPGDTVVISATPIPGNEEEVSRLINQLFQRGAEVIYPPLEPVHVSGHASQEEQKLLLSLTRPEFFVPVHGELRHLKAHARLAAALGVPEDHIFVVENGTVLVLDDEGLRVEGRAPGGYVFVDGRGVGDIGARVLDERRQLSQHGFITLVVPWDKYLGKMAGPLQVVSRGFACMTPEDKLHRGIREKVANTLDAMGPGKSTKAISGAVREAIAQYVYQETQRRPIIDVVVLPML